MINLTENLTPLKQIKQRRRIDHGATRIIVESVMKPHPCSYLHSPPPFSPSLSHTRGIPKILDNTVLRKHVCMWKRQRILEEPFYPADSGQPPIYSEKQLFSFTSLRKRRTDGRKGQYRLRYRKRSPRTDRSGAPQPTLRPVRASLPVHRKEIGGQKE